MKRVLLLAGLLVACGGGDDGGAPPLDASTDTSTSDSAVDGAADAMSDARVDSAADATVDSAADSALDAPCVPETDAVLCAAVGATCGTVTATDRCGDEGSRPCGSCAAPEACGVVEENLCDNADWVLTTIDDDGDAGKEVSLVIDDSDDLHVAYRRDRELRYATLTGGAWTVTTVDDPILGGDTAIAIDATGLVHIATPLGSTTPARAIDLWTLEAGSWTQTLMGTLSVTRIGLTFDGNAAQLCAYHPRSGGFGGILSHYAETGSGFDTQTITGTLGSSESREGNYCAIDFDGTDLHVGYHGGRFGRLEYAGESGGTWTPEVVDAPPGDLAGTYVSLALDGTGRPILGYKALLVGDPEIRIARQNGATWDVSTVGPAGVIANFTSIAIDGDDLAHLSYFDSNEPGTIRYARETTPGSFEVASVAVVGTGSGGHSAIAIDSSFEVHIVYYDVDASSLVHATRR